LKLKPGIHVLLFPLPHLFDIMFEEINSKKILFFSEFRCIQIRHECQYHKVLRRSVILSFPESGSENTVKFLSKRKACYSDV